MTESALRSLRQQTDPIACFRIDGQAGLFNIRTAYPEHIEVRRSDAVFFAEARSAAGGAFFDTAQPTPTDVLKWVVKRYDSDYSQVNFIIEMEAGRPLAFFGLSGVSYDLRRADFGRVLKVTDAPRGLMRTGIPLVFESVLPVIGVDMLTLEVFSDNKAALNLYQALGFDRVTTANMRLVNEGGRGTWRKLGPDQSPEVGDRQVIIMQRHCHKEGA